MMLSQQPQQNDALLERLERAKAKSKIKQSGWPDRHVVGREGQPVPFHLAQSLAYDSTRRIVALTAGTQVGKTSFSPWWLKKEIETCGGGDYLAVTSSFDLFKLKFLEQMLLVFEQILGWGRYWAGDKVLELKDPLTGSLCRGQSDGGYYYADFYLVKRKRGRPRKIQVKEPWIINKQQLCSTKA